MVRARHHLPSTETCPMEGCPPPVGFWGQESHRFRCQLLVKMRGLAKAVFGVWAAGHVPYAF